MKKFNAKLTVILGAVVVLLLGAANWYAINFNDWRLVKPTDFSTYEFRLQDLPMLVSVGLFVLYVLYLGVLLIGAGLAERRRAADTKSTREISPWLGLLGFAGFLGFLGFWTYRMDKSIYPFVFFMFFGYFSFFYEGKMSNTFMDERFRENQARAELTAHRAVIAILFLALVLLGRGALLGNLEYTLIAVVILLSLALALDVFLSEYLLYRYDQADQPDADGEE